MPTSSRQALSDRTFSARRPLPAPVLCPEGFDFPELLQKSSLLDSDEALDVLDDGALSFDDGALSFDDGALSFDDGALSFDDGALSIDGGVSRPDHDPLPTSSLWADPSAAVRPAPDPPAPLRPEGHRVGGSQSRGNARRAKRRADEVAARGHIPTAKTFQKRVLESSPLSTSEETARKTPPKLPAGDRKPWSLEELRCAGIRIVEWNGRESRPLLDQEGRIVAVLVGQPEGPQYQKAVAEAYDLLQCKTTAEAHRRGQFPVINCGILHQQGTKHPVRMRVAQPELTNRLLNASSFKALAGFASSSYQLWSQGVYNHSKSRLDKIYAEYGLDRNFANSVFPTAGFNFGPHAWTFRHRDCLNLPYGMCAVQALGHFDSTKGGHIVLWEFGVAVEFPAGACILLPSAAITHSNVPVQPGDTRASFTQFIPGGLLQQFQAEDPTGYAEMCRQKATRGERGLALLSRWKDLVRGWETS